MRKLMFLLIVYKFHLRLMVMLNNVTLHQLSKLTYLIGLSSFQVTLLNNRIGKGFCFHSELTI